MMLIARGFAGRDVEEGCRRTGSVLAVKGFLPRLIARAIGFPKSASRPKKIVFFAVQWFRLAASAMVKVR
jgi:hypothetical protein